MLDHQSRQLNIITTDFGPMVPIQWQDALLLFAKLLQLNATNTAQRTPSEYFTY